MHFFGFLSALILIFVLGCSHLGVITSPTQFFVELINQRESEYIILWHNNLSLEDAPKLKIHYYWAESVTKWPIVAFLASIVFCLGSSVICHLCYVKNPHICTMVGYLDYWGIAILFLGSAYP